MEPIIVSMSVKSQMETENIKEIGTAPDPSEVKSDLSTKKDVLVDFMKDELDIGEDIKCVADNSDQNEFSLEIVGQVSLQTASIYNRELIVHAYNEN